MKNFFSVALLAIVLAAIVFGSYRIAKWRFDECMSVGHSYLYCITMK